MTDEGLRALSDRLWFDHGQIYTEHRLREIELGVWRPLALLAVVGGVAALAVRWRVRLGR